MKEYKNRDEVEEEYKWDLSEFFESNEAFFKASEEVDSKIDIFNDYRGCTKDSNCSSICNIIQFLFSDSELGI